MNRDELILNDKPNTLVDGFAQIHYSETDVLSAMEAQAVEFAGWVAYEGWEYQSEGVWYNTIDKITIQSTTELYQIFNQTN